jgi:predicted ATP-grasp superfamily ATP-dependent carboligase
MIPVIVNQTAGQWAFEELAKILSKSLWVDIKEEFGDINYILCVAKKKHNINSFIPIESIEIAADKRKIEQRFNIYDVTRPKTFLTNNLKDVELVLSKFPQIQWILKYPTGCGGINHRFIDNILQIPKEWPKPFIIQEFIESLIPEVYRLYCVDGEIFGFNARRFKDTSNKIPWVSHAQGAIYQYGDNPDKEVLSLAKDALISVGLYHSFGVVDLVKNQIGKWFALEVGTDGIYNYVDREVDNIELFDEINERLATAFWKKIGTPPWGKHWKYREN